MRSRTGDSGVRLAELMAALSIATDLGMGQPLESALCSCVVAMLAAGAGRRCGLVEADVTALRRASLLHDIGRVGVSAGIWGKEGSGTSLTTVRTPIGSIAVVFAPIVLHCSQKASKGIHPGG